MGTTLEENLVPTSMLDSSRPVSGFEYLDHTADVQIHAWGRDLAEAFGQAAKAMFGYMTDLDLVQESATHHVEARGHDAQSALYNFLDEWLFAFSAEPFFVPFKIDILEFERIRSTGESDSFMSSIILSCSYFPQASRRKTNFESAHLVWERRSRWRSTPKALRSRQSPTQQCRSMRRTTTQKFL